MAMRASGRFVKLGGVLNNVAYSKNCHNGSFEIMRCLSKKAPCGSMSCWFIYTPHHLYSIWYIKVTIRGTLPKIQPYEIIGKTDSDFFNKELAEKYRVDDKRILESDKTEYLEEKYIQNGQEAIIQTVKTPLKDENGNTIGILGIFWDITERRQIEEALKESEELYRTIIENSNDMIWTLDTEGRFLFFNKRSEEITGFKLKDWQGKSFAPLIKQDDLDKVIEVFQKTLGGEPQQYEVSVKKEDGIDIILL